MPFAHESERHFAELLDFYGVRWEYEPVEFVLEWHEDRTPAAAFRPDFYLPDHGCFIELTTLSQKLVTRKNAKVRRLRELSPGGRGQASVPAGLSGPAGQVRVLPTLLTSRIGCRRDAPHVHAVIRRRATPRQLSGDRCATHRWSSATSTSGPSWSGSAAGRCRWPIRRGHSPSTSPAAAPPWPST